MSVLASMRTTSKAEFVNAASSIDDETIAFLTRLSARYSRLLAAPTAELSGELLDYAEKANATFPSDAQRIALRTEYLLKARAALRALDVRLGKCRRIMTKNPQGCFTDGKGNKVPPDEALELLDKMSDSLGTLIDREDELLKGQLKKMSQMKTEA